MYDEVNHLIDVLMGFNADFEQFDSVFFAELLRHFESDLSGYFVHFIADEENIRHFVVVVRVFELEFFVIQLLRLVERRQVSDVVEHQKKMHTTIHTRVIFLIVSSSSYSIIKRVLSGIVVNRSFLVFDVDRRDVQLFKDVFRDLY